MRRYVSERCKSAYLALSAALACLGMAAAQSIAPDEMHVQSFSYVPPPLVALRTQVQLVEVPVVVREGRQRTVGGLTKGDFEIYDNGKKQAITAFSVQISHRRAPPPLPARPLTPPGREASQRPASWLYASTICIPARSP